MKRESHPVDDLFRETLKDIKVAPSPNLRDRFLEEATRVGGKSWKNLWNSTNIFVLAGLVTLSVILYFLFFGETGETPGTAGIPEQKTESPVTFTNAAPNNHSKMNSNPEKTSSVNTGENSPEPAAKTDGIINYQARANNSSPTGEPTPANKPLLTAQAEFPIQAGSSSQDLRNPEMLDARPVEKEVAVPEPPSGINDNQEIQVKTLQDDPPQPQKMEVNPDPEADSQPLQNDIPVNVNLVQRQWKFSPYLAYHLDWNYTQSDNPFFHTLGIHGKLDYKQFSLTTGAGISIIQGYQQYRVRFLDFLGNYNKLDSITFTWDQNRYYLIPKYHMSETDVFDSTINLDSYRIVKQYRLLRVPVMMGYDLVKKGRFCLGVQSGLEMTAFLGSKTTNDYIYDPGRSKVISIDPDEELDVHTRLFWMFSLSAEYAITRRFSITLDPAGRYLLNPVENIGNTSDPRLNPYIRASFRIKF